MSKYRWPDKEIIVYMHNVILLGITERWNHTVCCYMDRSGNYHSKWSSSEGEGDRDLFSSYMGNKET